jgi:hypothetical protein
MLLFDNLSTSLFHGRRAEIVNCWEYKNCSEAVFKTCPAYPGNGSGCWMLSGVKCQGRKEFSSLDEQIAFCGRCDFYAHMERTGAPGTGRQQHMIKKLQVSEKNSGPARPDIP